MEFLRLRHTNNLYAEALTRLYTEAFPSNQRRSIEQQNLLIENNEKFYCNVVLLNNELVGFFNYWDFETFFFIEHMAIEPPLRGHKLGEKIITFVQNSVHVPLVLEAETVEYSEWGSRRLEFYRRLGFEIIPKDYLQPPYDKSEVYIPLHLLSNQLNFSTSNFDRIKKVIYEEVYGVVI